MPINNTERAGNIDASLLYIYDQVNRAYTVQLLLNEQGNVYFMRIIQNHMECYLYKNVDYSDNSNTKLESNLLFDQFSTPKNERALIL